MHEIVLLDEDVPYGAQSTELPVSTVAVETTLRGVASLNPTLMLVLVAVVWALVDFLLPGPWFVALLVAALIVNAALWLHGDWRRRRAGRAVDPTRPYSREDSH